MIGYNIFALIAGIEVLGIPASHLWRDCKCLTLKQKEQETDSP